MSSESAAPAAIPKASRAAHAELSATAEAFVDFALAEAECRDLVGFEALGRADSIFEAPPQPWPAFLSRQRIESIRREVGAFTALMRSAPGRIFKGDAEALGAFYGFEGEVARAMAMALADGARTRGAIARPDFIYTAEGLRCLELNLGAALGGWENAYRAASYLEVPAISRFLGQRGVEAKCPNVLARLLAHVLGSALRHFRSRRLNVLFFFPEIGKIWGGLEKLLEREGAQIRSALGLEGALWTRDDISGVTSRGGRLYLGSERIHAIVEGGWEPASSAVYRAWFGGEVLLWNGLATPVLTDKRNLALVSELVDEDLWSAEERELIRRFVPPTRRVSTEAVAGFGVPGIGPETLRDERERWVLKPSGGASGVDVFLGSETPEAEWESAVDRAFEAGDWLAQERLESRPFIFHGGESGPSAHDVVWSFFLFGETYGGGLIRMVPQVQGTVVNASHGATVGPIFEVPE